MVLPELRHAAAARALHIIAAGEAELQRFEAVGDIDPANSNCRAALCIKAAGYAVASSCLSCDRQPALACALTFS